MEKDRIETLVNHAQSGDLQAMEKLLEVAHTSVSYQCRKMMPRQEDAEDLTQEVLLAVYQKIDTLKEAKAFWSWLNRITATHCMNALSRNHVDLQFAEDEDGHSVVDDLEVLDEHSIPDKALDNAETARMIDEIVSSLPEAQRMSTLLYYYNEMSVKEIAQIMNVPENTVKSRLNLARKAIKDKVLDYEKQGVKLYSVSILPFLWYFLRAAAKSEANTSTAAACASSVMATGAAAGSTVVAVGGTVAAAGNTAAHAIGILLGKVIAGIATTALLLGGGAIALNNHISNSTTHNTTELETAPSTTPMETTELTLQGETTAETIMTDALTAYEELLTDGVTDRGLQIEYYAYWDLNEDGIPELLVADADGTPNSWSVAEVYTYRNATVIYCGSTNSRYDYFYHVNSEFLLGRHRMGNQFVSVDGHMEYSEEEFEYYNVMPDGSAPSGFIETTVPIPLTKNSYKSISDEEILRIFREAKDFYDMNIYGKRFIDASMYPPNSFAWIDGVIEFEGGLYQPCNNYTYDEFVQKLNAFFTTEVVEQLIKEVGLIEYDGKCYTYIREGVGAPYLGDYEITSYLTKDGAYRIQVSFIALDGNLDVEVMRCSKVNGVWVLDSYYFYGQ